MTSGHIPPEGEPGPDDILGALREAVRREPRLRGERAEEVARQLVLGGHLREEPDPTLVAEMLQALEAEEQNFEPDPLHGEE